MRILSWNVAGIRAIIKKLPERQSLAEFFQKQNADIICFQETKISSYGQLTRELASIPGYDSFWAFHEKIRGSSGVVTYVKQGLAKDAYAGFHNKFFDGMYVMYV